MQERGRREVFTSLFGKKDEEKNQNKLCVRPPYQKEGVDFLTACHACVTHACVGACEENIIVLDATNAPYIDFSKGGCTFCEACAKACEEDVLSLTCKEEKELHVKVKIDILACMAWHQNVCQSCLDACEMRAITFLGLFRPQINATLCNGCGMCVSICPSSAMRVYTKEER